MTESLPLLPPRPPTGHKGTFGTVAVIGGCCISPARMIGAPAFAALGALRAGAGLVRVLTPESILTEVLALCPSATGRALPTLPEGALDLAGAVPAVDEALATADAIVIGPGLGQSPAVAALALRAVQQQDRPIVVDADALNALATIPELFRDFHASAILTPHPGEYRRLAALLKITIDPVNEATRPAAAEHLAQRLGCVVVLKGAGTVVSDGLRTWTCTHRHACLATAGTGDVLAGVIAGLLAQHARGKAPISLYNLARIAVEAHAKAAAAWAGTHHTESGMLAPELAELIPRALESLRTPN